MTKLFYHKILPSALKDVQLLIYAYEAMRKNGGVSVTPL